MKTFLIIVEDRTECDFKVYSIEAINRTDAETQFCRKFLPYLDFPFSNITDMLEKEDVYITITEQETIIKL